MQVGELWLSFDKVQSLNYFKLTSNGNRCGKTRINGDQSVNGAVSNVFIAWVLLLEIRNFTLVIVFNGNKYSVLWVRAALSWSLVGSELHKPHKNLPSMFCLK